MTPRLLCGKGLSSEEERVLKPVRERTSQQSVPLEVGYFSAPLFAALLVGLIVATNRGRARTARRVHAQRAAAPAASLCAGHAQQLGGESPLANLMEVKA